MVRRVIHGDTFWRRLRGLLGRGALTPDEGFLLAPCNAIHTFFMKFPIDVVFLDAEGQVVGVIESLPPWRWRINTRGRAVLELSAGTVNRARLRQGDQIRFISV